jgi:hypothetical protein
MCPSPGLAAVEEAAAAEGHPTPQEEEEVPLIDTGLPEPLPELNGDLEDGGGPGKRPARAKLGLLPLVALIFYEVSGGPFGTEARAQLSLNRVCRSACAAAAHALAAVPCLFVSTCARTHACTHACMQWHCAVQEPCYRSKPLRPCCC